MSEQLSNLAIALALTAKHIDPVEYTIAKLLPSVNVLPGAPHSKKTIRARKRNRLAAKSRKRNRR